MWCAANPREPPLCTACWPLVHFLVCTRRLRGGGFGARQASLGVTVDGRLHFLADENRRDHEHEKQNEEDEKQKLRDARSDAGDSGESKSTGNERDDGADDSPL